ncbi:MAG TPA: hypothetical protein DCY35_02150 [Prolixibacteraceae bacterium]|nr:hypothetical protein [Prolixibacteraceae bacterium]
MSKENRQKARVDEPKAKAGIGAFNELLSNEPVDFMPVILYKATWEVLTGGKAERSIRVYFGLRPGAHDKSIVEMIAVGTSPDEKGTHRDRLDKIIVLGESVREISQSPEVWKESRRNWKDWQKRFKKPSNDGGRDENLLPNAVLLNQDVLWSLFGEEKVESLSLQPEMDMEVSLLMVSDSEDGANGYYNFAKPCPPYCDTSSDLL